MAKRTKKSSPAPKRTDIAETRPQSRRLPIKKWHILVVLIIVFLALLGYRYKSAVMVATVNGQPLSRVAYYQELEKQGGKAALDAMVTKTLISQEAKNRNISVSDEEINAEIKKIEESLTKQGQNLEQVLTLRGLKREDLNEQIRLQKMLEKMAVSTINVSDKEVDDYLAANQESLPEGEQTADVRNSVKEQLKQQKTNEAIQKFLQSLQEKAKINYFIQ